TDTVYRAAEGRERQQRRGETRDRSRKSPMLDLRGATTENCSSIGSARDHSETEQGIRLGCSLGVMCAKQRISQGGCHPHPSLVLGQCEFESHPHLRARYAVSILEICR